MPRRLAQQRTTMSNLECLKSSSASRAISAAVELLVSDTAERRDQRINIKHIKTR